MMNARNRGDASWTSLILSRTGRSAELRSQRASPSVPCPASEVTCGRLGVGRTVDVRLRPGEGSFSTRSGHSCFPLSSLWLKTARNGVALALLGQRTSGLQVFRHLAHAPGPRASADARPLERSRGKASDGNLRPERAPEARVPKASP